MIDKIEIQLPDDSINGLERKLKHKGLEINENLEMQQVAKIEYYKNGTPVSEYIKSDTDLTDKQKQGRVKMYEGITYGNNTIGAFVDALTGQQVTTNENGELPTGSVTELTFWQNLPASFFSGTNLATIAPDYTWHSGDTLAELVYNGIQFSMLKMAERNRV